MIVTITLFVVGFILPPQGEISGSVLLAGGILMLPVCVFIIGCARVAGVGGAVEIDLKNGNIKFGKDETTTKEI